MIAKNCTQEDLQAALVAVNSDHRYAGNIRFKTMETKGRRISFTLTVVSSTIGTGKAKVTAPGVSMSPDGKRRIAAACWHVHGDFFDALFNLCPGAEVYSSGSLANPKTGKWINKDGGNWQDWNKGSMMNPVPASKCCNCKRNIKTEKILAAQRGI
jgi:hypothetical protein